MTSPELERLAKTGLLKHEPPSRDEFEGLLRSAEVRLADALKEGLSPESRFDLAYNASHSLALAALRWHGYRSEKRYVVFQALAHTLGMPPATWRILDKCHTVRNHAEYEGVDEIDDALLQALLAAAAELMRGVRALPVPGSPDAKA